jgi:hypothetical protein
MLDFCGFIPQAAQHAQTNGHGDWTESDYASWYLSRLASWRADDYNHWLAVGMALMAIPNGLHLWDTWSQQSTKYAPGLCERKWSSFPSNPQGIALLGGWAKQDDPQGSNGKHKGERVQDMPEYHGQHAQPNGQHAQKKEQHAHDMHKVLSALESHIRPTCTTCTTFPVDLFAGVWKDMIVETSHAVECDPAIAGTTMLAMASAVLQHNTTIQVNATREQNVNIYATVAAPTGSGKTPIYWYFMRAIDAIENDKAKEWESQWEAHKELPDNERGTPPQDEPPVIYTTDTTSESLSSMLLANNGAGAVLSDEGDVFNTVLGRYERGGKVANLSTYLKAWDGRSIRISRARKTQKLATSALTVLIQTQPDILRELSSKREIKERGFLPRFLVCVAQDLRDKVTGKTTPVRRETIDSYIEHMKQFYRQGERVLRLEPEAKRRAQEYHLNIRRQLKTTYRDVQEFAAKAENQVLRLTGLLHTMHAAPGDDIIRLESVEKAIKLFEYYLSFVMTEDVLLADTTESDMIVKVIDRLPSTTGETFHLSKIRKSLHITRRDQEQHDMLQDALTTLVDCGVLTELETNRKDSRAFVARVHVETLQKFVHVVHVEKKSSDISLCNGQNEGEDTLCMSCACCPDSCACREDSCACSESDEDATNSDIPHTNGESEQSDSPQPSEHQDDCACCASPWEDDLEQCLSKILDEDAQVCQGEDGLYRWYTPDGQGLSPGYPTAQAAEQWFQLAVSAITSAEMEQAA